MLITDSMKLVLFRANIIAYLNSRVCPYVTESMSRIESGIKWERMVHIANRPCLES